MASLFTLKTSDGTTTYYGSVYIDGKRYRKKLSTTKSTAQKMQQQLEPVEPSSQYKHGDNADAS